MCLMNPEKQTEAWTTGVQVAKSNQQPPLLKDQLEFSLCIFIILFFGGGGGWGGGAILLSRVVPCS